MKYQFNLLRMLSKVFSGFHKSVKTGSIPVSAIYTLVIQLAEIVLEEVIKLNKFYLNLGVTTIKDIKTKEKLSRRYLENEISISFNKNGQRVEIKIRRSKDASKDHFMIDEEESFLNGLVKLKDITNPQNIWDYFEKNSGLDLSQLVFQMDFFSLEDKEEFDSKKTFKFGFEIRDGKTRIYNNLLEKHEQRLALLPKSEDNVGDNL